MGEYDAIVVGARCAGAPTAMLLARRGYRVLLTDRADFPSDVPHGHFIHRDGPRRLQRWGLLERLVAGGCPPIDGMTSDYGDGPVVGDGLSVDGVALGYAPRRTVLDALLVEAAVAAGAELRPRFLVEGVAAVGERVVGIRGRAAGGGAAVTERARVTVGADGRNSRLARAVRAPTYEAAPALTCWYFAYWADVPARGVEIYLRGQRAIFVFPTHDDLVGIFICWPAAALPAVRADIDGQFLAAIDAVPELAARMRAGRRVERYRGASDVPNFYRRPFGPGWALVGDAGCHKDPFLALGVGDAFRDAEWLAEALDEGLSGRRPLAAALADFARRRDEASLPDYRQNLHLAGFGPLPPDLRRLRAAVRGQPEASRHLIMASEGMIAREAFFNPDNLARLLAGVPAA